jgi:hypothetical protein
VCQWGTFDAEKRLIDLRDAAHPDNENLLDLAAVQTYLNGGTVYVVKPGEVPGRALSAAVLRYQGLTVSQTGRAHRVAAQAAREAVSG